MNEQRPTTPAMTYLPGSDGEYRPCPELLTENELIDFLRVREISKAKDYHNVIDNLKRMRDLPTLHVCGQPLYPREAILEWIRNNTHSGKQ